MFTALLVNLICALIAGVIATGVCISTLDFRTNSFGPGGPTQEDRNRIGNWPGVR